MSKQSPHNSNLKKMLCLIGPLPADMLADDGAARNSSHACDFSHTLLRLTQSGFRFSSRDVSTRPSTGRPDPLHPRSVAAVEPFLCQALEGRVSDISGHDCYSWLLNSNERSRTGIKHHQGNLFLRGTPWGCRQHR